MSFFQQIEGDAAILVERGVYRQVDLYRRDGYLYAKLAGVSLDFMSYSGPLAQRLGRLCTPDVEGAKSLDGAATVRLLGS